MSIGACWRVYFKKNQENVYESKGEKDYIPEFFFYVTPIVLYTLRVKLMVRINAYF
jgi:hypothetical protein